jgi:hypothetical protein
MDEIGELCGRQISSVLALVDTLKTILSMSMAFIRHTRMLKS